MISLLCLVAAIACYSIKELHAHSKLRWQKGNASFWGEESDRRKYKWHDGDPDVLIHAPKNLYYKLIKAKYVERWFTSTWLTVAFTDAPHALQALFFILVSLSVSIPLETRWNEWWEFVGVWSLVHILHAGLYKFLSK